jgi:hypothetical protein
MSALLEKSEVSDVLVLRAKRIYVEKLKSILEPEQRGRFVAIEPESERYFVGDTGTAALIQAHDEMPNQVFYLARIGYDAADTLHGHGERNR